jgi:NTE family protein
VSGEGDRLLRRVGPPGRPPLRPARTPRPAAELAATLARAARRPFAARPWSVLAAFVPDGSVSTDLITEGIAGLHGDAWPTDPLLVCAVRQRDGRRVVFGRDGRRPALPDAVAASCAIPGFFQPVEIDGERYLDGGVHSPTNADVLLADEPPDLVLVSSPMSRQGRRPRLAPDQPMRGWAGALLDAEAARLRRRGVTVVAFQPDPTVLERMGANAMDPSRRAAIATEAHRSASRKLARADVAARLAALRP